MSSGVTVEQRAGALGAFDRERRGSALGVASTGEQRKKEKQVSVAWFVDGEYLNEVTEPRNDGTHGSDLYTVPFRLSKPVSHG